MLRRSAATLIALGALPAAAGLRDHRPCRGRRRRRDVLNDEAEPT